MSDIQKFRFCLRCQREALILNNSCCFCDGKFILHSAKVDFNNHTVKQHYKRKKMKQS